MNFTYSPSNKICQKSTFLFPFDFQVSIAIRILEWLISRADPALGGSEFGLSLSAIFDNLWPLKKITYLRNSWKGSLLRSALTSLTQGANRSRSPPSNLSLTFLMVSSFNLSMNREPEPDVDSCNLKYIYLSNSYKTNFCKNLKGEHYIYHTVILERFNIKE